MNKVKKIHATEYIKEFTTHVKGKKIAPRYMIKYLVHLLF